MDFLATTRPVDSIVTNPPYALAQPFVLHALNQVRDRVAMLLKLSFLEGQKRKPFFESTPLARVYVFSKRVSFNRGTEENKGAGLLAYAWYVWDKLHVGPPSLAWI